MDNCRLQLCIEGSGTPIISASGELDYTNCNLLGTAIENNLIDSNTCLKLALSGISFLDSSGLRTLLVAAQNARKLGKPLVILSLTPQLARMLHLSGFDHLFVMSAPTEASKAAESRVIDRGALSFDSHASADVCRDIRNRIGDFAGQAGFDTSALEDIKLAVGEAVSNAIRHGTCCGDIIKTQCSVGDNQLSITLTYSSAEFNPHAVPVPDSESCANGGMGIHFMKLVMDDVRYEFDNGYTIITLEKRIWE